MITTTLMPFNMVYSKKYDQYTSIYHKDDEIYAVPMHLQQFAGLGVVESIVYKNEKNFILVNAHKLQAQPMTLDTISWIIKEEDLCADDCTLVEDRFLALPDNRCIFIEDEKTYVADYDIGKGTPINVLLSVEPTYIPFEIAVCIAVNKGLKSPVYDGFYVYSGNKAYTVNDMQVVTLPRSFVKEENDQVVITDKDIETFRLTHGISNKMSDNKIIDIDLGIFGREITLHMFSRNGYTLSDFMYGSKEVYKVENSIKELESLRRDAARYIGRKAIPELNRISLRNILYCNLES